MENEYLNDAVFFIHQVAKDLTEKLSYEDTVRLTLNFALGMERVLKGILFSLNPIYVYRSQDFKNTVPLLYKDKLLPNASYNQEIAKEPDGDVLTFKLSLLRATTISKVTEKHKNLLFALSNFRDIIAHQRLSLFNTDSAKVLLFRDFYPVVSDYCTEFGYPISHFINSYDIKLATISAKYQEAIEDRLRIKLESHRKRWEQLSNVPGFVEKMQTRTKILQEQGDLKVVECPACGNDAILSIEPEYDYVDGEDIIVGMFVSSLKCLFCKLNINDYQEIDFLNLDNLLFGEAWEEE